MNDRGTAIYKVTFHFSLGGEAFADTQEGVDQYLREEVLETLEDYIPSDHMKFYRRDSVIAEVVSIEFDEQENADER